MSYIHKVKPGVRVHGQSTVGFKGDEQWNALEKCPYAIAILFTIKGLNFIERSLHKQSSSETSLLTLSKP